MISYVKLTHFKSFSNVEFDLRGPHGIPKKFAFIYGENGAGKSNLVLSALFIGQTMDTLNNQMYEMPPVRDLDVIKDDDVKQKILTEIMKARSFSLSDIIQQYWSIGNEKPMEIEIGFRIDDKDGHYIAHFSKEGIIKEELYGPLKGKAGVIFTISPEKVFLSPSVFLSKKYENEIREEVKKYWGKHTFLSISSYEQKRKNKEYLNKMLSPELFRVKDEIEKISILCKIDYGVSGKGFAPFPFLHELEEGVINNPKNKQLVACEKMLNDYFTKLYSDIKSVHYHFSSTKGKSYHYTLFFDKLISGKICPVPVTLESTGTRRLLDILPFLFVNTMGQTVLIDEIDSGVHDLLMEQIVKLILESLKEPSSGQLIITTHNTLLLDLIPPENVYVIRSDAYGQKEISCITKYKFRTQKNNSVRVKYLHGFYDGVPTPSDLDLQELVTDALSEINPKKEDRSKSLSKKDEGEKNE